MWVIGAVAAGFVAVAGLSYYFSANEKLKRRMGKLPVVPLGEVSDGQEGRFVGELLLGDHHLVAPISGRPCAAWRVRIYENRGKNGSHLQADEWEAFSFRMRDGDIVAEVEGDGLELAMKMDRKGHNSLFGGGQGEAIEAFMRERGLRVRGMFYKKHLSYEEAVLEEGERVVVAGRCRMERDSSKMGRGYRDVGERIVIEGLDDGSVLATDDASVGW